MYGSSNPGQYINATYRKVKISRQRDTKRLNLKRTEETSRKQSKQVSDVEREEKDGDWDWFLSARAADGHDCRFAWFFLRLPPAAAYGRQDKVLYRSFPCLILLSWWHKVTVNVCHIIYGTRILPHPSQFPQWPGSALLCLLFLLSQSQPECVWWCTKCPTGSSHLQRTYTMLWHYCAFCRVLNTSIDDPSGRAV